MSTPIQISSNAAGLRSQPQGVTVKTGEGLGRVQVTCSHQSGLIYVAPGERSWVCSDELRPAHAIAGFFRELIALKEARVERLLQEWGIYYRSLPLESDADETEK